MSHTSHTNTTCPRYHTPYGTWLTVIPHMGHDSLSCPIWDMTHYHTPYGTWLTVIPHMGHDSLSQISYRATWLTTHSRMSHITHMNRVTHMNTSCHTRIRRAYRSLLQKSPIKETIFCKCDLYSGTHEYVVPHRATWRSARRRMSHVTHMNLSCHTGQRDSSLADEVERALCVSCEVCVLCLLIW